MSALSAAQDARIGRYGDDPRFRNARTCGTIAAVDLMVSDAGYLSEIGPRLRAFFLDRGMLIRPLGDVVYLMPPYCVTDAELDRLHDAVLEAPDVLGIP